MAVVDEVKQIEEFFQLVVEGSSELTAALALGWTPLQLRRYKEQDEFIAMLNEAEDGFLDNVETAVKQQALRGTRWAAEMVLYNRRPDRWRPPAHKIAVEHTDRTTLEVVYTAAGALRELLSEEGAQVTVAQLQKRQQHAIEAHATDTV